MRAVTLTLILLLAAGVMRAATEETVDQLKARLPSASAENRAEISLRIAQLQLRAADKLYGEGHLEEARAAVADIADYCEKARDSALQSRKHVKAVEINARKMADKLRDIKRTLAFEDQAPVDQAIRRLEDIRTTLLKEMFSNKKEKK
jgi:soluble cytochrome b562